LYTKITTEQRLIIKATANDQNSFIFVLEKEKNTKNFSKKETKKKEESSLFERFQFLLFRNI